MHFLYKRSILIVSDRLTAYLTNLPLQVKNQIKSLKSAYFTPELWDKEDIDFLTAFLFETPLALLRFSIPWFIIIYGIAFAITYLRYKKELEKTA